MERGEKIKCKKGQVTIFIIVGILLVVGIILIYFFQNQLGISNRLGTNPTQFIQTCAKESIVPAMENVVSHGGIYYSSLNDEQFFLVNGSRFAILCEANTSKSNCINNHPLINNEIGIKMTKLLTSKISSCFTKLKNSYPNMEISQDKLEFEIKVASSGTIVKIRKKVFMSLDNQSNYFSNFDFRLDSSLYNFGELAIVIVNTESSCDCTKKAFSPIGANEASNPFLTIDPYTGNCDADLIKLNSNYPSYVFSRINFDDGWKIYRIEDSSFKTFSFAVRNCFPANDTEITDTKTTYKGATTCLRCR